MFKTWPRSAPIESALVMACALGGCAGALNSATLIENNGPDLRFSVSSGSSPGQIKISADLSLLTSAQTGFFVVIAAEPEAPLCDDSTKFLFEADPLILEPTTWTKDLPADFGDLVSVRGCVTTESGFNQNVGLIRNVPRTGPDSPLAPSSFVCRSNDSLHGSVICDWAFDSGYSANSSISIYAALGAEPADCSGTSGSTLIATELVVPGSMQASASITSANPLPLDLVTGLRGRYGFRACVSKTASNLTAISTSGAVLLKDLVAPPQLNLPSFLNRSGGSGGIYNFSMTSTPPMFSQQNYDIHTVKYFAMLDGKSFTDADCLTDGATGGTKGWSAAAGTSTASHLFGVSFLGPLSMPIAINNVLFVGPPFDYAVWVCVLDESGNVRATCIDYESQNSLPSACRANPPID
jgi:hypothetical protein